MEGGTQELTGVSLPERLYINIHGGRASAGGIRGSGEASHSPSCRPAMRRGWCPSVNQSHSCPPAAGCPRSSGGSPSISWREGELVGGSGQPRGMCPLPDQRCRSWGLPRLTGRTWNTHLGNQLGSPEKSPSSRATASPPRFMSVRCTQAIFFPAGKGCGAQHGHRRGPTGPGPPLLPQHSPSQRSTVWKMSVVLMP